MSARREKRRHRRTAAVAPAAPARPAAAPDRFAVCSGGFSRFRIAPQVILLAAVAFAVYANTLSNGFVNDDEHQVLMNPWIKDVRSIPSIFSGSVWGFLHSRTVSDYYRPIMHLIYLISYQLFGFQAWGFHLVNVLFHVVNTSLVFFFATRLTGLSGEGGTELRGAPGHFMLSVPFVAALLFATHPAHTEAVAWVASIPELSFTFLYLLSFYFYIGTAVRLRPSLLLFCLALLCKETAITLPILMAVYDVALRNEERSMKTTLARYSPYVLAAVLYLMIRHHVLSRIMVSAPRVWDLSPYQFVIHVFVLFRDYVGTLLLPIHLNFWHSFHPHTSALNLDGMTSLAVAAAFVCAAALFWKKSRLSFFCLALILIPLLPAFYITALPGKPFAERYLYLPSVGFVFLIALGLNRVSRVKELRIVVIAVVALLTAFYSVATVRRNRVWHDVFTLYLDTVKYTADAPVPPHSLAMTLVNMGRVDEAIAQYRILVKDSPDNAIYESSLGSALFLKGQTEEAIEHLKRALSIDPRSLESHNDLAIALKRKGLQQEAMSQYRKALEIDPEYADAHFNLGSALAETGRMEEAMQHYRAAVKSKPENAYYRNVLGIECAKQGLVEEAIEQFREAVRLSPSEPAYRNNLDRALALQRRP